MPEYDAVVIGAGHNGLIASGYLARAGARVLVLERRAIVGGACVTEEPWPGYRINTYAYSSGLLRPKIVRELELERYGYEPILPDPQAFAPQPDGRSLTFWVDEERNANEVARFSKKDGRAYPKYVRFWDETLDLIEPAMMAPPTGIGEFLRALPDRQGESLLRELFLRSAKEFLDDWFESDELKGALATGSIIGTFAGPNTPGTAYILGHHSIGTLNGHRRVWGHTKGGMGRLTEAIALSGRHHGVRIELGQAVRSIRIQGGRAIGVETTDGRRFEARTVISSVDPKTTFLRMVDPAVLPETFRRRVEQIRAEGACLKVNAALRGLPEFRGSNGPESLRGAVDLAPSMEYLDRAFDEAKYGAFSSRPYIDAYFQSVVDSSVAPPGCHTMTCFVQYAPTTLAGRSWDDERERVARTVLDTMEEYAPGIASQVVHHQVVTPLDLERVLGLPGGNIDQGDITPDQIFSLRPIPGWSGYRTPIEGLYLCGSGTHPGGGVIGAPGHNAAHVVLSDLKGAG